MGQISLKATPFVFTTKLMAQIFLMSLIWQIGFYFYYCFYCEKEKLTTIYFSDYVLKDSEMQLYIKEIVNEETGQLEKKF